MLATIAAAAKLRKPKLADGDAEEATYGVTSKLAESATVFLSLHFLSLLPTWHPIFTNSDIVGVLQLVSEKKCRPPLFEMYVD